MTAALLLLLLNAAPYPPVRVASDVLPLQKSAAWSDARAEVHFRAQSINVHSGSGDQVDHVLVLRPRKGAEELTVPLQHYSFGYLGTDAPDLRAPTLEATFKLNVAPDGHALAVFANFGTGLHYVALDAPEPFSCEFPNATGGDAWLQTRQVAIDSFRSASRPPCPIAKVTLFACAHVDDEELWKSLAEASSRYSMGIFNNRLDEERDQVLRCTHDAAQRHAAVSKTFADILTKKNVHEAAEALAFVPDAEIQNALVAFYRRNAKPSPDLWCWSLAAPIYSIAATASRTHALTPEATALVRELANGMPLCESELGGKGAQAYAYDALISLGGDDRKKMEALAKGCEAWPGTWPDYTRPNAIVPLLYSDRSCWAKAALAAKSRK
ncbi:MAG: hypothetical protein ACJ790_14615 [Myxococcaceae bacterium]